MKVKGTQTTVQSVDIEISEQEIRNVVINQTVEYLADALQEKMRRDFISKLKPDFKGTRIIREGFNQKNRGKLVLVHVDADWNYHTNVGLDEEIRPLSEEEVVKYQMISGLAHYITQLKK